MSEEWEVRARESYDAVAEPYARLTRAAVEGNPYLTGTYTTFAGLARAVPGDASGTVVDVGCGPGWWAQHLAGQGVEAIGVDLSPAMVELARANVPQARFEVGSVLDLPLPSQSAAGVACLYVLHHVPDDSLDRAVGELVRLLVPGGILLLGGHVGEGRTLKTSGYGGHPMHVHVIRRPAASWEERLRAAGLTVEAHTVYDPDDASPSHALFARRPA